LDNKFNIKLECKSQNDDTNTDIFVLSLRIIINNITAAKVGCLLYTH